MAEQSGDPAQRPPADTPARRAFERGDYAEVRRLTRDGLRHEDDRPLQRATAVDPVHAAVLALCLLGLIAILLQYAR